MTATSTDPEIILDAHQDIAWNVLGYGRDWMLGVHHQRRLEADSDVVARNGIVTSGFPEAILGRVGIIFGTIFAAPAEAQFDPKVVGYATAAQAYKMGMDQLDVYHRLADRNDKVVLIRQQSDLSTVLQSWQPNVPIDQHKIGICLLMEGADPIREPKEFEAWYERGLRICGLAWTQTRYSGGTSRNGRGPGPLTKIGRELLDVMASFNAILDLSHMSEDSYLESVDHYEGPIIASHSNPRSFCNTDRHLTDHMIRRLVERDGVIGAVPYNAFLRDNYRSGDPKSLTPLSLYLDVIDHYCQVAGSARNIGLGSDFDGGFGAGQIPSEMDTVADLQLVGAGLRQRGYADSDVRAILSGNFLRVLRTALPQ